MDNNQKLVKRPHLICPLPHKTKLSLDICKRTEREKREERWDKERERERERRVRSYFRRGKVSLSLLSQKGERGAPFMLEPSASRLFIATFKSVQNSILFGLEHKLTY